MSKRILYGIAAVGLVLAGLYFRADSARTARERADEIVQIDAAGADVTSEIAQLKNYAAVHMGASVNFTLKGSYDRAVAAAKAAASAADPNAKIYADAQKACAGKTDSVTAAKCHQNYLSSHLSAAPTPTPAPAPSPEPYQYKVAAPIWTPDLAGALLLGAVLAIAFGYLKFKPRKRRK